LGFTTNTCIDGLDDALFKRNFTVVIIAHEKEAVLKIFKKIRVAWENFPEELKSGLGYKASTDSANELSFNNGSSIRVALSSRADTVNRLHVSEFGKICKKYPSKAEEIITGAIPSVPMGGRIDIESTAEGDYGYFHDMFWEAWGRTPIVKTQFKGFFFPWTTDPTYVVKEPVAIDMRDYQEEHNLTDDQIRWYIVMRNELKKKMLQEYPTTPEEAFESSGHKLFDMASIKKQEALVVEGKAVNEWTFFSDYIPSHRYAIGADVAEGVGQDSSTAIIIDFTKGHVVGTYANNMIEPDMFAHILAKAGEKYGECLIAVERNNHGHATLAILKQIYQNIYTQIRIDRTNDKTTDKMGWLTTGASKPKMLFDLNDAINESLLIVKSKPLLAELRSYDKEDLSQVRFDDDQTKHWDLVMACAICWQMKNEVGLGHIEVVSDTGESFDSYDPL